MLSHFVRGKGFVVIILIALFAGLSFFGADYSARTAGTGTENCFVKVYGRCYRLKEARKLSEFHLLANRLFLVDFARSLFGEDRLDDDPTDFVMNLIVLRKEAQRLGIEPTVEEVRAAVPGLPIFQIQTFMDDDYIRDNLLGPRGLSEGDFFDLIRDYLSWQRIHDLLEAGHRIPSDEVEKRYIRENQRFTASLIEFNRADFTDKVEVTDADVEEYYETNKEALLSDDRRAFKIVHFTPSEPAEDSTEEQKAQQRLDFANLVNEIYAELVTEGTDFDLTIQAAKETAGDAASQSAIGGIEVADLEAFPRVTPPEDLKEQQQLVAGLFSQSLTMDRPTTIPIQQEDGSYKLYKLTELTPPGPLTIEEAREQIVTALKARKSDQLVNEAANNARGKIAEALDAGKTIEQAAKAAGVELKPLDPFSEREPPTGLKDPGAIVGSVLKLGPKSVSDVILRPAGEGYYLAIVDKIELYEDAEADVRKKTIENLTRGQFRRTLFNAWFDKVRKNSGAQRSRSVVEDQPPGPAPGPPVS